MPFPTEAPALAMLVVASLPVRVELRVERVAGAP